MEVTFLLLPASYSPGDFHSPFCSWWYWLIFSSPCLVSPQVLGTQYLLVALYTLLLEGGDYKEQGDYQFLFLGIPNLVGKKIFCLPNWMWLPACSCQSHQELMKCVHLTCMQNSHMTSEHWNGVVNWMPVAHIQPADFPLNVQLCLEAGKGCLISVARCALLANSPASLLLPEAPGYLTSATVLLLKAAGASLWC